MPIEIKELHIRIAVNASPSQAGTSPDNSGGSSGKTGGGESSGKDEIIAECVERVMEIIHRKKER